jgi:hypothetical protein
MKDQPALRELVVQVILAAGDAASVNRAEQCLIEWLDAHPGDDAMRMYGGGLYRMREAIRLTEAGLGDVRDPRKRVLP